ncbi:MAG TPA: hypothetical protein DD435_07225 [Cyanobacteria bacterium UBA8530]|nr:hypothetical protein [Cyanobacteria bacterium UBA8530]
MIEKIRKFFKALGKKEGGFTLIELAVILAVIGILAGVGVMKYVDITSGAKKTNAQARLADIKSCVSMAMAKNGGHASALMVEAVVKAGFPLAKVDTGKGLITFAEIVDNAATPVEVNFQLVNSTSVAPTSEGSLTAAPVAADTIENVLMLPAPTW